MAGAGPGHDSAPLCRMTVPWHLARSSPASSLGDDAGERTASHAGEPLGPGNRCSSRADRIMTNTRVDVWWRCVCVVSTVGVMCAYAEWGWEGLVMAACTV